MIGGEYSCLRIRPQSSLMRKKELFQSTKVVEWFSIECRKIIGLISFRHKIGLKRVYHFFIQSEVKPKPIVTRSHTFSRALRQPHVITSSFDWFTVLSVFFVIGWSDYLGFGFTALN